MDLETTTTHIGTGPWNEFPDSYWRAYFGKEADYYMQQLQSLRNGERCAFSGTAFFLGFTWMAYRKMYFIVAAVLIVIMLEGSLELLLVTMFDIPPQTERIIDIVSRLALGVALGLFGNRMYIWNARREIRNEVGLGGGSVEALMIERLAKRGGIAWWPVLIVFFCGVLIGLFNLYVSDLN